MPAQATRLRDTLLALAGIPSPSRCERAVADWIRSCATRMDYVVEEDDAGRTIGGDCGNLFIRVPGNGPGPKLFLSAHMDTVEKGDSPLRPRIEGDFAVSDGTTIVGADDKTGVTVLLELLACLREERIRHGDLCIAFSVAEETELLGAKAMAPERTAGFDAGIVLDHSRPDEIPVGAPGKRALAITVHGKGGHGAHPERRINAAHVLARTMARLPSGRLDEHSTCCLGVLRAGTAINVIPEIAHAEYEIRSHRGDLLAYHLENTLATIEAAVREARLFLAEDERGGRQTGAVRRATVDVDVAESYESFSLDATSLPVRLLRRAITAIGLQPQTLLSAGGSDANVMNRRGLPTALLGCGMHGAHSVQERASLPEMIQSVAVLLQVVQDGNP